MSNVIQMNKATDIKAMHAAIPTRSDLDMSSGEAETLYEALSMMEPADRDAAIYQCDDIMLKSHYSAWLNTQG